MDEFEFLDKNDPSESILSEEDFKNYYLKKRQEFRQLTSDRNSSIGFLSLGRLSELNVENLPPLRLTNAGVEVVPETTTHASQDVLPSAPDSGAISERVHTEKTFVNLSNQNLAESSKDNINFTSESIIDEENLKKFYFQKREEFRQSMSGKNTSINFPSTGPPVDFNAERNQPSLLTETTDIKVSSTADDKIFLKPAIPPIVPKSRIDIERAKALEVLQSSKRVNDFLEGNSNMIRPALEDLDALFSKCSVTPTTPRVFQEGLVSLTADDETPFVDKKGARSSSMADFPIRSTSDAEKFLREDAIAFRANTKNVQHDSNISSFSDLLHNITRSNSMASSMESIGHYFAKRSDDINLLMGSPNADNKENQSSNNIQSLSTTANTLLSQSPKKDTITDIRLLLANPDLTSTAIAEALTKKAGSNIAVKEEKKNEERAIILKGTGDATSVFHQSQNIAALSQSRHSTPLGHQTRRVLRPANQDDATPIKTNAAAVKKGRLLFNSVNSLVQESTGYLESGSQTQSQASSNTYIGETVSSLSNTLKATSANCAVETSTWPGPWIVFKSPVESTVEMNKKCFVSIPLASRDRWLKMQMTCVEMATEGSVFRLTRENNCWMKPAYIFISDICMDFPPNLEQSIRMEIVCEKLMSPTLLIGFTITDTITGENQDVTCILRLTVLPSDSAFSLTPNHLFSFGSLPVGCYNDQTFRLTYFGEQETTITVCLDKDCTIFQFLSEVLVDGEKVKCCLWKKNAFQLQLKGKAEQTVEFAVRIVSTTSEDIEEKKLVEYKNDLIVLSITEEKPMLNCVARCELTGSVAYAKFEPDCDFAPLLFRTSPDIPAKSFYKLFNTGAVPLTFSSEVLSQRDPEVVDDSNIFIVPQTIVIPVNKEGTVDVTFTGRCHEKFVSRFLSLRILPNGKKFFIDLIGCFSGVPDDDAKSTRSSVRSRSSATSVGNYDPIAIKLIASTNALSWAATTLQESVIQSFEVKIKSQSAVTAKLSFAEETEVFKVINERGEPQSKCRKLLKPDAQTTFYVLFKPNAIGLQTNILNFEFSNATKLCQMPLTGFGGCPRLRIEGTESDVHGNKMVKLGHSSNGNSLHTAQFRITNYGNVEGFVQINILRTVLPLVHALNVYPLEATIQPNANIVVTVSQRLSMQESQDITGQYDIRKLATLSLVMGDEPCRQRLRSFVQSGGTTTRSEIDKLIVPFPRERQLNSTCKESKDFETVFLKSLKSVEVIVAFEKEEGLSEITELDLEDDSMSFTSLCDTILVRPSGSKAASEKSVDVRSRKASRTSYESAGEASKKISDWLQNLK